MRRWRALALGAVLVAAGCATLAPRRGSATAAWLAGAPYTVGRHDVVFVDAARPENARDGRDATPRRTLVTAVWYPVDAPGPHPLVLYSHGFLGTREGGTYLAEALARRGYVVAAPDHPLTHRRWGPGAEVVDDVVEQPADLRVVADRILAWSPAERPFAGDVDPQRIGVMGLSLGGMTATLAAFHPRLRDPRIRAAVSLAGPMTIFGAPFFAGVPVPFLMIAGDEDVVIDYATNAPLVLERVPDGALVTIHGGSHVGFDDAADGPLVVLPNADVVACRWLGWRLDLRRSRDTLAGLAGPDGGILVPPEIPRPCARPAPFSALAPTRQHQVTALAVTAFFESVLAADPATRVMAAAYLRDGLGADFPVASYQASPLRPAATPTQPCATANTASSARERMRSFP